ncbi:MAG: FkbM family methyltransferase [Actinomycetota bacterium]
MSQVHAATIVARNFLPFAKVLADSYRRNHGAEFTVLVVDAVEGELEEFGADEVVRLMTPEQLDIDQDDFSRMAMSYSAAELCTAVKPWLLRKLLVDHEVALYLDPDIEVFRPFADEVGHIAAEHAIALTPHVLAPTPRDGLRPTEADLMASGVFNLGFIAVSRDAEEFLRLWETRLRQDAISAPGEQLFFDQRWVDNVPAMFPHKVISDPGFNVAYWNVYQRPLKRSAEGTITADGALLRFMHFSGYRPEMPWLTSVHYADNPRVLLSESPLLADIFENYRCKLLEAGYESVGSVPYRWAALADGTALPTSLRLAFRQAWMEAERLGKTPPRGPFGPDGASDFIAWATEPADAEQERAGLNLWALAVWETRHELQTAFPDPLGVHAASFRAWCNTSAVSEGELPAGAVPDLHQQKPVPIRRSLGVNLLGYLSTESGVGELGRHVQEAVRASGVPVAITIEESTVLNRTGHAIPEDTLQNEPEFGVSVVCVNADMTPMTLRMHPEFAKDRYVIGVWVWELADFPPAMRSAFAHVDEVWTCSDFCARSIANESPVPVQTFPTPVRDPFVTTHPERPADGMTRFLFVFDHNSVFARKNPTAATTAFERAFADRADVGLVIKSINGDKHPGDREQLRAAAAGDGRIELIEHYLDHDDVTKLFAVSDCYLSLHRSEGFGFTVAEAMAHGLPVIATDYSATKELLTIETGWPIPFRLVPVGPGNQPYPAGAEWAEPDIDSAVAALQEVADNPSLARQRGAAARQHVLSTRSLPVAADWVRERLEDAYEQWRNKGGRGAVPTGPAAVVRAAREVMRWQPDTKAPSKLPLAPMLRRGVLRALDHHDNHQRIVLGVLMDAVEGGLSQLADRADRAEQELARTRAMLAATQNERDKLAASSAQRIDAVDRKLIELLRGRDRRMDNAETALGDVASDLRRELPILRQGLLHLFDLLNPPPEQPTETVATDVGMLRLPADDTVMLPWLRYYGTWEVDEARLIDRLLPEGGVFVDIGAHVGYFTVRALQRVGGNGSVIAVEPWSKVRELLEINVSVNVAPRVARALNVLPVAAWDSGGLLRLGLSDEGNTDDNRITSNGSVEVEGVRLDGVPALSARRIDVVKSDAQGSDHRALAGMTELLKLHRPQVVCEFDPGSISETGDDPASVLRMYRSWGYLPVPITSALLNESSAADVSRVRVNLPPTDEEIIESARNSEEGFVSLWLRLAAEETST